MITYSRNFLLSKCCWWKHFQTTLHYSTQQTKSLKGPLDQSTWTHLKSLGLTRNFRGRRGGYWSNWSNKIDNINTIKPVISRRIFESINQVERRHSNNNNLVYIKPAISRESSKRNIDNTSTGIKVAHLNIRSLRNIPHLIQLKDFATTTKIDVITISETWLNSTVTSQEINIEGYKLFRLDRLHKKGGGVCAYIRSELKATVIKDLSNISENNFHQLWLNIQYKKLKSMLVCVTYRPQDCHVNSFEDLFKPNVITALTYNKPIIILGDLNCNLLDKDCSEFSALTEFSNDLNLTQHIKSPTRITDSSQTLLDVILTSPTTRVLNSGVLDTAISDHLPVYIELKLKSPKPVPHYITVRSYKNYCPDLFTADLSRNADSLLSIFDEDDVDVKLGIFYDTVLSTLNNHAPIKTIKVCNRPCPFVTPNIKQLMKERDRLHRHFLLSRNTHDWEQYKEYQRLVKNELRKAEKDHTYEQTQQHKDQPNALWKIIRRAIPSKENSTQAYSKDLKTIANEFNQYFSSVGKVAADTSSQLAKDNNITLSNPVAAGPSEPTNDLFHLKHVTIEDVRRIVLAMPSNKAPGPDRIHTRVLKDCLPIIIGPLTDIINCSFQTSTFPEKWKTAEVIPLLKDGDHEIPANNRPVSLLSIVSKICEKIVLEQFNTYLTNYQRLTPHQSGNRKQHSTETLNLYTTDIILDAMDKRNFTALILLDLSKAFDSISHTVLLHKLTAIGASPHTVQWFKSYLSNRTQSVRIESTLSDPLPITHGMPQGAILSPLLFCIFLNDLPSVANTCKMESYVDDTKVCLTFKPNESDVAQKKLEENLYNIAKWCCENSLLINPDKTKLIIFGTRQLLQRSSANFSLSFLGKPITPSKSVKDLGVILDPQLSYDDHIANLTSSCTATLCQINRVKNSFDSKTLSLIINSLVMSKLLYCSTVWSNTSDKNIKKLQQVQNFACKIITNSRKYDHVTPLLQELNWMTVKQHLQYRDAVMAFKCYNNLTPLYLTSKLRRRSDIHNRRTRNCDMLDTPLYKTASGQRTFTYKATKILNNMSKELKELTINQFKKQYKNQILSEL